METKTFRKDFSRLGFHMLIGAVLIYGVQIAGQYIALAVNKEWRENTNIMLASGMIPMYVIGYPVTFLIMRAGGKNQAIEKHRMKPGHFILAFLMSYALLMLGNIIGLFVTFGIGIIKGEPVSNSLADVVSNGNIWISAIYIVLLAPAFEEYLFRKLICDRVVKYGQGTAILLSGLMFGLFHGNFNQFFYAFFIGCFFAFIYVKTGNIKYTIGLHMIVNFIGSVVGGLLLQNIDLSGDLMQMNPMHMIIYALYMLVIFGIVIAGGVLLLANLSKFRVNSGEISLGKGERAKTVLVNAGMLLYCIAFIIMMIIQALFL